MPNIVTERMAFFLCMAFLLPLLASCNEENGVRLPVLEDYDKKIVNKERSNLRLGVVTGPYGDMFTNIVEPLLAEKGYSIEIITYDNYVEPNFALASGDIDLNVFQHYKHLNKFKSEFQLDLSAISEIPTASMGVYSRKYSSLDSLVERASVAIPNDSTNLARALVVLSAAGLIAVDPTADKAKLTLRDIVKNIRKLNFVPLEAPLLCDALQYHDLAVINGNFAISGGLNISDALFNEALTSHEYINVVTVRTDDLSEKFVMDLISVLHSKEYVKAIAEPGGRYSHFQYPCNFRSLLK